MEDDFKDYDEYYFLRQYPDAPDQAELAESMAAMQTTEPSDSMDGMQLAMGARGQSAEQRQKFESQSMVDYIGSEAKEAVQTIAPEMGRMGLASAKGTGQQFLGTPGDIIMIGRGVEAIMNRGGDETKVQAFLRGMQEKTILPTTEDIKKWVDTNIGKVGDGDHPYETLGEFSGLGGQVKAAKVVAKGVKAATKEAAPIVGEAFEKYAATTGLTSYIVQPKRSLGTLVKKLESGAMDEQSYIEGTKLLNDALQRKPVKVSETDKRRGADEITRRLLGALSPTAQVQLEESVARFGKWLLDNNPQLANDLGIAITKSGESGMAGGYESFDRIATIIADKANPGTVVHEILHHSEQMMPIEVQNGVADAWTNAYLKAFKDADPKTQKYLALIPKAISNPGARKVLFDGFKRGDLDYNTHYQLVNPSEFWAVNATRIMSSRYEAGSWIGKAKVWLNEFAEKSKGAFGLPSDSPVLRGLKSVTKGSGKIETDMLTDPLNVYESMTRVVDKAKKSEQRKNVAKKVEKGAAVTATGAALTGDEGQK